MSLAKAGVFAETHGRAAVHRIAAKFLGHVTDEAFDGKGYCYLETGAGIAVKAEGSFFDPPHPVMNQQTGDERQMRDRLDSVTRLLRPVW